MESGSGNKNSILEVESSYEPICWVNHFGDNINRKGEEGYEFNSRDGDELLLVL